MYAIGKTESWQVIAFNRDGTQMKLCTARTLEKLIGEYAKTTERMLKHFTGHEVLKSFKKITVWNVDQGFTGLDLPYIETI